LQALREIHAALDFREISPERKGRSCGKASPVVSTYHEPLITKEWASAKAASPARFGSAQGTMFVRHHINVNIMVGG